MYKYTWILYPLCSYFSISSRAIVGMWFLCISSCMCSSIDAVIVSSPSGAASSYPCVWWLLAQWAKCCSSVWWCVPPTNLTCDSMHCVLSHFSPCRNMLTLCLLSFIGSFICRWPNWTGFASVVATYQNSGPWWHRPGKTHPTKEWTDPWTFCLDIWLDGVI